MVKRGTLTTLKRRLTYIYWIESRMPVLHGTKVFATCCMLLLKVTLGQGSSIKFTTTPPAKINVLFGQNITFHWRFGFGNSPSSYFDEMILGVTDNDRIKDKYLTIEGSDLNEIPNTNVDQAILNRLSVISKTVNATEINVVFLLQNVQRTDASPKTYGCKVEFDLHTYRNGPIELIVSPSITIWSNSLRVVAGDQVDLFCDADGAPKPYVTWFHKGVILQNSTTNYYYRITSITTSQEGIYKCTAGNKGGTVSNGGIDVQVEAK
ncbi:uncharacterized protein [Montipora foliosa]|uniref:uncharacterized protein isoform X1 n=2 Tax=Montipora foliosa TaxID=591990 RepID=UPI0035F16E35